MAVKVIYKDENKLFEGDCLDILPTIESNSVDAVITDAPAGIAFMLKDWDKDKGGRDNWIAWMTLVMIECKRVLKDGGHIIVWALPRTSHWTAMAIEDAGFEIRDIVHHIFNTGFPKSLDLGKVADKKLGNQRTVVGEKISPDGKKLSERTPNSKDNYHPSHKTMSGASKHDIWKTKGNTACEGYGTLLRPACEHWILARKPIAEKTIVDQVLKTGTGAINIDGCRIPIRENDDVIAKNPHTASKGTEAYNVNCYGKYNPTAPVDYKDIAEQSGRFPANVTVTGDALNDGIVTKSPSGKVNRKKRAGNVFTSESCGFNSENNTSSGLGDEGSKSRYFDIDLWAEKNGILQIPKPSQSEKNKGCENIEPQYQANAEFRPNHLEKAMQGDSGKPHGRYTKTSNNHPTVKSVSLMAWFVKLISREGDVILDPFAGSGTTLITAKRMGRKYIGIEKEKEYIKIIKARLKEETSLFDFEYKNE